MRVSAALRPTLSMASALCIFSACSGSQSLPSGVTLAPISVPAEGLAQKSRPLVFVSIMYSQIDVYQQTGMNKLAKTIKGQENPQGLAVDSAGDLFVANTYGPYVSEYAPPYKKVAAIIPAATGQEPVGVAVSKDGILAVTSYSTASGLGNVTFYPKGSTAACATIASDDLPRPVFDGFDLKDNLYVDGGPGFGSGVAVGRIKGACKAKKLELLMTANSLSAPGGIKVDRTGDIAIMNQGSSPVTIYTYNPPKKHSLGKPVSTTQLDGLEYGLSFAFTASGDQLYAADSYFGVDMMREYAYPGGGQATNQFSIQGGYPVDQATAPAFFP
ncbi:MAG TPA: hypothetical protein VGF98_02140 [Candidatus Tumulicola sp.]|jgi:hypothetical protein